MRTPALERQVVSAAGEQREKDKKELEPTIRTLRVRSAAVPLK